MHSAPFQILQAKENERAQNRSQERYPIAYNPGSSTRVNTARLPPLKELSKMELAFREEPQSEAALSKSVNRLILLFTIIAPLALFVLSLVGPIIPLLWAAGVSAVVGILVSLVLVFFPRRRRPRLILKWLFGPTLTVACFYLLSTTLQSRPMAIVVIGSLLTFLLFFVSRELRPLHFYRDYLYTHPRLKPQTRKQKTAGGPTRPSLWGFLFVAFAVAIGGAYAPASSAIILLAMSLSLLIFSGPLKIYRLARRVLSHYLTYSGRDSGAAGVWMPKSTRERRRAYAFFTAILFYLCFHFGFGFYFPTELQTTARRARELVTREHLSLAEARAQTRDEYFSLSEIQKEFGIQKEGIELAEEVFWRRNADVYGPLKTYYREQLKDGVEFRPVVVLLIQCGAGILLPNVILLFLFSEPLKDAERLRRKIEGHHKSVFSRAWHKAFFQLKNLARLFRGKEILKEPPQTWVPGLDDDGRTEWQWYVDRLNTSKHKAVDALGNVVRESEHLFLGVEPTLQFPILLDRRIAAEHCYIVGQTGSGKTSLGIMPLLIQLIRGYCIYKPFDSVDFFDLAKNWSEERIPASRRNGRKFRVPKFAYRLGGMAQAAKEQYMRAEFWHSLGEFWRSKPVPIVIIDLKGDPALFHTARLEAKNRGQEFRFFTPEKGKVTHLFNPFVGFQSESRTFIQLCHLFLDSLSLNHGEGYGRSYYSRRNRQALFDALTHPSCPQTFPELLEVMIGLSQKSDYKDSYEALSTVHALSQYESLITTDEQEKNAPHTTINMERVIEERQVVYFYLPSAIESISSREIGKLALFSLLSAAIDRQQAHPEKEPQQVYLFVDEFQRLAGENFKIILEQARSFGISAILANQTLSDLKNRDFDLRPTILTNTRMQLYFTVNDAHEMRMLSDVSGEEIRVLKSWSLDENLKLFFRRQSQREAWSEGFKNRLTANDILSISDHPLEAITHITRGSGYTQFGGLPFRVRMTYPISAQDYHARSRATWPTEEEFDLGEVIENIRSPKEIDMESLAEVRQRQQEILSQVLGEVD